MYSSWLCCVWPIRLSPSLEFLAAGFEAVGATSAPPLFDELSHSPESTSSCKRLDSSSLACSLVFAHT